MGEVGNNGNDNMSFAATVADRLAIQPTATAAGPFHNGATSGTQFADLDNEAMALSVWWEKWRARKDSNLRPSDS